MKKSEVAKLLYDNINLYSDYLQTGFLNNRTEDSNFDYLDIEPENNTKNITRPFSNFEKVDNIDENQSYNQEFKEDSDNILSKREIIKLSAEIIKCNKCGVVSQTIKPTPGLGNPLADIFVISDISFLSNEKNQIPMSNDNLDFFKKWINGIEIDQNKLYITNIIKCNLENTSINSQKLKDIIEHCNNYIIRQINLVKPILIFVLGEFVLSSLFKKNIQMKDNHGKIFSYNNVPLIATYHPKEVLKDLELKKIVWGDLKLLKSFYDGKIKNG